MLLTYTRPSEGAIQLQGWFPRGQPGAAGSADLRGSHFLQVTGLLLECNVFVVSFSCKQSHQFFSLVLCRPLSHLCSRRLNIVGDEEVLIWLGREKQGRGGMFNWLPAERASTSGKRGGFLFPVSRCVTIFTSY